MGVVDWCGLPSGSPRVCINNVDVRACLVGVLPWSGCVGAYDRAALVGPLRASLQGPTAVELLTLETNTSR